MNVRIFWLGCAQSLLALSLAGCCCEPVAPRSGCGPIVKGRHAGSCGHAGNCGQAGCGRLSAHRPLFHFEQVCPYGFPPYNPAPLGYASGFSNAIEVSASRHVLIAPSAAQPSPTKVPAPLPSAVDENAKRLPADNADPVPVAKDPPKATPQETPVAVPEENANTPHAIVQPRHAPRKTEPNVTVDPNLEEAPLPTTTEQPVSVPVPDANSGDDNLPQNPLEKQEATKAPATEAPKVEPTPKADTTDDADEKGDGESTDDEWPDAPLPKNDLPPLAGPVR
jgi:hypothetical protein